MHATERKRFSAVLMVLPELYGRDLSPMMLDLWWRSLEDFDLAAVERAMETWVKSTDGGKFPPKPADIRLLLEGGNSTDAAMVAFSKFEKAVRQVGPYRTVVFDDPIIHRVVYDMGGWADRFAHATADEWPFIANEFRTRYTGLKRLGTAPDYPRTLIGIAEGENGRTGRPVASPVLIGDPAKAQAVLDGGRDAAKLLTFTTMVQAINAIPEARE